MKISQIVSRLALLSVVCIGGTAAAEERRDALILGDSVAFSYIASVGFEYFSHSPERIRCRWAAAHRHLVDEKTVNRI
jgi:hypothetical protein